MTNERQLAINECSCSIHFPKKVERKCNCIKFGNFCYKFYCKKEMNLDFILNNSGEVDKVVQLQLQNGEEPSNSYSLLAPKRNLKKKIQIDNLGFIIL